MRTRLRSLRASELGNIAVIFAIAIVPLMMGLGAAVDYSRANIAISDSSACCQSSGCDRCITRDSAKRYPDKGPTRCTAIGVRLRNFARNGRGSIAGLFRRSSNFSRCSTWRKTSRSQVSHGGFRSVLGQRHFEPLSKKYALSGGGCSHYGGTCGSPTVLMPECGGPRLAIRGSRLTARRVLARDQRKLLIAR